MSLKIIVVMVFTALLLAGCANAGASSKGSSAPTPDPSASPTISKTSADNCTVAVYVDGKPNFGTALVNYQGPDAESFCEDGNGAPNPPNFTGTNGVFTGIPGDLLNLSEFGVDNAKEPVVCKIKVDPDGTAATVMDTGGLVGDNLCAYMEG